MAVSAGSGTMGELIAAKDWSKTAIGPSGEWSPTLRTVLRTMLGSRYAMWMGWGPELTFFYNDAYGAQTLGAKHPWALGRAAREVWAEIWEAIGPLADTVLRGGGATWSEGLLLFLERSGYPEETYHTFSYSPLPGDAPVEIGGLLCVVVEETERVIGERRIALLGRCASALSQTKTVKEVFGALEACLTDEARDFPFSLTYLVDDDGKAIRRVSKTGFAGDHPAAFLEAGIDDATAWPLAAVLASRQPIVVDLDPSVDWPMGPWKRRPARALLLPMARSGEERLAGVFVAGCNPHRPLDESAQNFARLFAGQIERSLSNASAYEEARKRVEAFAALDRAKTAFFSNVSHEFRTPLTLMLAAIEDMRASAERRSEERERIELLHRNAQRLLKLVNTLLDFARLEAGRAVAHYEATDLAAFTTDLASNFRSATERAGLALVVDCPPLSEPVFVDRGMWERIVLNLLSNALKFTFEGRIRVSLGRANGAAELSVADTGTGIPAEDLPRLFERFHRVEGARSRSHEGSGIGLALVHELARMHGGTVDVASRVGEGTTFRVRIPLGRSHLTPEHVAPPRALDSSARQAGAYVEEALRWVSPSSDSIPSPARGGAANDARILVADDNADMREYVTRLLRERWEVVAVSNGRAALDAIVRDPPDLVISDVMMPELDGFGLLAALRADPSTRTVPVILLSARAGEEATMEGLRAGADDYLVKPFTARDLLVRVAARLAAAKAARETLHQRRNLYRHFMQAPFPIVVYMGPRHVIDLVNRACLRVWNKTDAIAGMPVAEAVPELAGEPIFGWLDDVYRTGLPFEGREVPSQVPTSDGRGFEQAYFTFVYAPLFDPIGAVEGVLTCAFDVTDAVVAKKSTELALADAAATQRRAFEVSEQTNRAKDEFLSTMSHELRTPLNAMLGWASILRKDASDSAKLDRGLAVIERNAQTQARLVNDLLDVSRIISGKLRLTTRRVDLATVIAAAADAVRPAADAKAVHFVLDLDAHLGAVVGDPDRLQQVVWNLLSNAIRFTPPEGRVTVTAHRANSSVVVSVRDTGVGIPHEHLRHIFERFTQIDSSTTRAHGGLGLGLAIVRHLVEAHGGTVSASSEGTGRGAAFMVTLPIRAVTPASESAPEIEPLADALSDAEAASSAPPFRASLAHVRALIVDDDHDSLELIRLLLEGAGAHVTTATTAMNAAEVLDTRGSFDIIISDIGMPDMDGYTFMQRVRSRAAASEIPAIALTAYARTEDAERAARAGYQEHLAKPVDANKLLAAVENWASWTR
jgi:signal transduction histidine kinase/DNA-binding response OmpR family regulator